MSTFLAVARKYSLLLTVLVVGLCIARTSWAGPTTTYSWIARFEIPQQFIWEQRLGPGLQKKLLSGEAEVTEQTSRVFRGTSAGVNVEASAGTVSGNLEGRVNVSKPSYWPNPGPVTVDISYAPIADESQINAYLGARYTAWVTANVDLPFPIPDIDNAEIELLPEAIGFDWKGDFTAYLGVEGRVSGESTTIASVGADLIVCGVSVSAYPYQSAFVTPGRIEGSLKYTCLDTPVGDQESFFTNFVLAQDNKIVPVELNLDKPGYWEVEVTDLTLRGTTFYHKIGAKISASAWSLSVEFGNFDLPVALWENPGFELLIPDVLPTLGRFYIYVDWVSAGPPVLEAFGTQQGWQPTFDLRTLADVNRDGMADIVGFGRDGTYVSLATGKSDTPFEMPTLALTTFRYSPGEGGGWRVDKHPRMLADVNGDGMADIVGFGGSGVQVALATGDPETPFEGAQLVLPGEFGNYPSAGGWEVQEHPRMLADVNGDGMADIVGFGYDGVMVALAKTPDQVTAELPVFHQPLMAVPAAFCSSGGWNEDAYPRLLGDVNGDGNADIVGFGWGGTLVSLATGKSDTPFEMSTLVLTTFRYGPGDGGGWRVNKHPRMLADVNGDGMADIVGFGYDGVMVALATGDPETPFERSRIVLTEFGHDLGAGEWVVQKHPRMLADVNGDGMADTVGFANMGVRVALATGDPEMPFEASQKWIDAYGYSEGWRVDKHPRMLADVNGDGQAEIVGFGDLGVHVTQF